MRARLIASATAVTMLMLLGAAGHAGAAATCEEGGPCSCGALYAVDRCSGIGNNACGCGAGFTGPSLGPTSDCSISFPSNSCCLPTGETYATACLGREGGVACTGNSQCSSGACVNGICGAGGPTPAAAPTSSATQLALLVGGLLAAGWWHLQRRRRA